MTQKAIIYNAVLLFIISCYCWGSA